MNDDFLDMLKALIGEEVEFMVVGAYALAVHDVPRATGDIGIWIQRSRQNAARVWRALNEFGAPVGALHVFQEDLNTEGTVIQLGLPPRRIDLMTSISGLDFTTAAAGRIYRRIGEFEVPFIGREDLVRNKLATGRTKDLADAENLEQKE